MATPTTPASESSAGIFIVDNSDSDWKVRSYLREWCELSKAIDIATGYFEIGSLLALDEKWQAVDHFRILMGDEVSMRTKRAFADGLKKIAQRLDGSLEAEKSKDDFLGGVPAIVAAIRAGKIECRVYRKDKFHAKACITHGRAAVVGSFGLVGSSNFTFPGLCENVELNVQVRGSEVGLLQEWYERHWQDAEDITPDILRTLERHPAPLRPRPGRALHAAPEGGKGNHHHPSPRPASPARHHADPQMLDGTQLNHGNQNRPLPTQRNPQDAPRKRMVVRHHRRGRGAYGFGKSIRLSQRHAPP